MGADSGRLEQLASSRARRLTTLMDYKVVEEILGVITLVLAAPYCRLLLQSSALYCFSTRGTSIVVTFGGTPPGGAQCVRIRCLTWCSTSACQRFFPFPPAHRAHCVRIGSLFFIPWELIFALGDGGCLGGCFGDCLGYCWL
ncbi:unnamed protein product [Calypogeia fissa]